MRIGIDIDGVVADTFHLLVNELNTFFSRDIQPRNVTSYDLCEVYGINAEQLENFSTASKNKLTEAPQPVPGALECLEGSIPVSSFGWMYWWKITCKMPGRSVTVILPYYFWMPHTTRALCRHWCSAATPGKKSVPTSN